MNWWVADLWHSDRVLLVSWVFWVVLSICLHELAHGWAAIRLGDRTPIDSGHMTWNPLVHMGPVSLILFAICGIAWGAMPVNPTRLRGARAEAQVAFAGPAMNLVIAGACILAAGAWLAYAGIGSTAKVNVLTFLTTGGFLNIALAALNMLPIPPLDGSRILADFVPSYARAIAHPNAPMIGMMAVLIAFTTLGGPVFGVANDLTADGVAAVARSLPGGAASAAPSDLNFWELNQRAVELAADLDPGDRARLREIIEQGRKAPPGSDEEIQALRAFLEASERLMPPAPDALP
jgi:Zn-dependent protease